jgi:hypothetical protein
LTEISVKNISDNFESKSSNVFQKIQFQKRLNQQMLTPNKKSNFFEEQRFNLLYSSSFIQIIPCPHPIHLNRKKKRLRPESAEYVQTRFLSLFVLKP